jgi:hypothetical protein
MKGVITSAASINDEVCADSRFEQQLHVRATLVADWFPKNFADVNPGTQP